MSAKNKATMLTEETYLEMKRLVKEYEDRKLDSSNADTEQPYLYSANIETERQYNPKYGNDRICKCGHPYHRHFDNYEEMEAVGCKYCQCWEFEKAKVKS